MTSTRTNFQSLLFGAALAVALAAQGDSLPLASLPATAKWVVHVDVKALRESPLGTDVLAAVPGSPGETKLSAFEALTSINLRRDVDAVTLCGAGLADQGAIIYLRGHWDLPRLTAVLAAADGFASRPHGKHTLMSWNDRKAPAGANRQQACFVSTTLAVLSDREETLKQALAVLDGARPSLATVRGFKELNAAADVRCFARAAALDVRDLVAANTQAAVLRQTDTIRLGVGSDAQGVQIALNAKAATPEAAMQVQQVLLGIQTLALLQGIKDPDISQIAQSARIAVQGQDVSVALALPMDLAKRLLAKQKLRAADGAPPPAHN